MKRLLLILLICGALSAAGCGGDPAQPPEPAAPTAGTRAPLPTETAPGEEPPVPIGTLPAGTDPVALPTEGPGPAQPVKEELGGGTFTLGDQTFRMGESPRRLLAFLGEPEERFSYGDSLYDGTDHFYHYKDVWVTAFQPAGSDGQVLTDVYFLTDRFSFDGLSVGSSAAALRRAAPPESETAYPLFCYEDFQMGTEIGGWGYRLDREQESPGDACWIFLFNREDDPRIPADGDPILCIRLHLTYPFPLL